ncbi:MAG: metallophosphoesterase [Lachnospiraceae bacterium]|nr:metallophosphoesterase [Lachnospiraceae bacterium]
MIFIWKAAALAVFFLTVMAVDCNRFVIRRYKYRAKGLLKDGRAILLSDLHSKSFGKDSKKLLTAIDRLNPDMILIAGDMYTCAKGEDTGTAMKLVCALAEKYPVYYGNGNHEHKTRVMPEDFGSIYEEYEDALKKAGVRYLINEKAYLPDFNMDIYGLEIHRDYYGKFKRIKMEAGYIQKLLGRPDTGRVSLLIAHNPDFFEAYAKWGADLVVSGHVHGGLMRLPVLGGVISPAIRLFPAFDGGEFKKDKAVMILGRGLGSHTLPIRIFNPGELVVIDLYR